MCTVIKEIRVPGNRKVNVEVELPPDYPEGQAVVTLVFESKNKPKNRMAEIEGKYRGKVWMADDFDAPLEDFAEYM